MRKYCDSISQLRFFIFYIIFPFIQFILIHTFSFLFFFFSSTHVSSSRTFQQFSFSLFFLQLSLPPLFFLRSNRENEKKKSNGDERKKEAMERMREKKKNPNESNSSWYNFLIKKIQLLMYSSPSDLMSYCS